MRERPALRWRWWGRKAARVYGAVRGAEEWAVAEEVAVFCPHSATTRMRGTKGRICVEDHEGNRPRVSGGYSVPGRASHCQSSSRAVPARHVRVKATKGAGMARDPLGMSTMDHRKAALCQRHCASLDRLPRPFRSRAD
jgi:hypothetical protein